LLGKGDCRDCPVAVFDFDGVLVFLDGEMWDNPDGLSCLKDAVKRGLIVYVVSGRRKRDLHLVKSFLRRHSVSLPDKQLILRTKHVSEIDHKLEAAYKVLEREGCIGEWHDDNPYVLDSMRKIVCRALVLYVRGKPFNYHGRSLLSCIER
jgi:hypothetical protein